MSIIGKGNLKRMGTDKVVEVMTVSEEALALFALEDKYEFWFRSYHLIQGKEMPSPHPAIHAISSMTEHVEDGSDARGRGESSESDSSEGSDTDTDDDDEDVNESNFGKGMRQRNKKKQKEGVTPRTKRATLQNRQNSSDKNDSAKEKERRKNIENRVVQNLGMNPVFTSGKPQAWPLGAVDRFNTWCAFLEIFRKSESCEQMQHEISLKKSKEDYLGLVIKSKRGKRSLLEMMGDDEEEVRSRVGSIFDGSSIPGSDLSTVGKVYSRYNAKYVTGSVTSIVGV